MVHSRILVVEDDVVCAKLMQRTLRQAGYQVDVAGSCAAARHCLRTEELSAVFVDYELPDGNGVEIIRSIRANPDRAWLPLIMCTASEHDSTLKAAYDAGCTDFMRKPARPLEILIRARSALTLVETARRQMDSNRRRLLSRVGSMIAHEINNPLAAVTGSVQALEQMLPDSDRRERRVRLAMSGLERISVLVKDLRIMTLPEHDTQVACIAEIARVVGRLLSVRNRGAVHIEVEAGPGQILVSPGEIVQACYTIAGSLLDLAEGAGQGILRVNCQEADGSVFCRIQLETEHPVVWRSQDLEIGLARRQLDLDRGNSRLMVGEYVNGITLQFPTLASLDRRHGLVG